MEPALGGLSLTTVARQNSRRLVGGSWLTSMDVDGPLVIAGFRGPAVEGERHRDRDLGRVGTKVGSARAV